MSHPFGRSKPADVLSCRECGCWEMDACWDDEAGACWWVEDDLCSHCQTSEVAPMRFRGWAIVGLAVLAWAVVACIYLAVMGPLS